MCVNNLSKMYLRRRQSVSIHLVQKLNKNDLDHRAEFHEKLGERYYSRHNLTSNILFRTFTLNASATSNNCRYYSRVNPRWVKEGHNQRPQKTNVLVRFVGGIVIKLFLSKDILHPIFKLNCFEQRVIPNLKTLCPHWWNVWLHQDGAPAHYVLQIREYFNETFRNQSMSRRSLIELIHMRWYKK